MVIGVADCGKYPNYERWMLQVPHVEVVRLGYNFSKDAGKCHGILLTGGEDVHPQFYHHPEYLSLCEADNMDERRDEFELNLLQQSQENQIPVLGICRGLQIANVFFGGTLIPDIPRSGKPDHAKVDGKDRYHQVEIMPGTLLRAATHVPGGEVNSAHHQAAADAGRDLIVSAYSTDGVIEAMERPAAKGSFLMLVQWHPERMVNASSPLVANLRQAFLNAANKLNVP